jgi:hypothetical protein
LRAQAARIDRTLIVSAGINSKAVIASSRVISLALH